MLSTIRACRRFSNDRMRPSAAFELEKPVSLTAIASTGNRSSPVNALTTPSSTKRWQASRPLQRRKRSPTRCAVSAQGGELGVTNCSWHPQSRSPATGHLLPRTTDRAKRTDLIGSSVKPEPHGCKAPSAHRRGSGRRATPAGSSHDFDVAGIAGRCCWRATGPGNGAFPYTREIECRAPLADLLRLSSRQARDSRRRSESARGRARSRPSNRRRCTRPGRPTSGDCPRGKTVTVAADP